MKALIFGLFSIAIAAAAAFGAHQYLQGEKGFWAPLMKHVAGPEIAVESEEPSPEAIAKKTQQLLQLVESNDRESASRRATALLEQVDHAYNALTQDPRTSRCEHSSTKPQPARVSVVPTHGWGKREEAVNSTSGRRCVARLCRKRS
ncbi:hypothetical protein LCGC14_2109050 [marine sediment metagenome]|uniref:Uncharacterized protein n=1 Tax=marine sediment metagenome TaxID=412755 RepID=A0A0F9E7Q8_9ZZZZ